MSVFSDFSKNISSIARTGMLAAMALASTSCGGDDPVNPNPEPGTGGGQKGSFVVYKDAATSGVVYGEPGRPGYPDVGIPDIKAQITGITLYTSSKVFKADFNNTGKDKFIVVPKEGQEPSFKLVNKLTGSTAIDGIDGFAFIKNGIDTTFVKLENDARLLMFAVEKDSHVAMKPATVKVENGRIVKNSGGVAAKML